MPSRTSQPHPLPALGSASLRPADSDVGTSAGPPRELGGLRVLVVEDDPDIRELLASILAQAGAVVASAESAATGFDEVRRFRPQLLVSDIGMPREDGYSFIRRVRALGDDAGGQIPSIALTAFTSDGDRARALRAGFTLHMGKPVEAFELVYAVKTLANAERALGA